MNEHDQKPPLNAQIKWHNQSDTTHFIATSGTNHTLAIDPDNQTGAKPTELVLMGLASCASVDVVGILKKSRQNVLSVECFATAKRADSIPAVFTDVHLHFVVEGDVDAKQLERAIHLSASKYCSVGKMLSQGGVNISHDFKIITQ